MKYYDHSKEERNKISGKISSQILKDFSSGSKEYFIKYASDDDTYIRKAVYPASGNSAHIPQKRLRTLSIIPEF